MKVKVAIVHDDLFQWGGAEKVLLAISEIFPEAPIYTAFLDNDNPILREKFFGKKIITSFLQKLPLAKEIYKPSFFLHGLAFELFDLSEFDLVISQTTRFAKSIITKPDTRHICYCHTPPRFLWNFSGESTKLPLMSSLRIYDQVSSQRVDQFLAGSKNAQARIKKIYGRESMLLYPFVDIPNRSSFNGDYFLIIARLNRYKRVDLAVKVFNKLGMRLKIVGSGPELGNLIKLAKSNVEFLGQLDDEGVAEVLSGCRALIVTAEEDFGLTPLEAQALGKPVMAFGKGGALETVVDETGIFFDQQTEESLLQTIKKFERRKFKPENSIQQAQKFSKAVFRQRLLELTG